MLYYKQSEPSDYFRKGSFESEIEFHRLAFPASSAVLTCHDMFFFLNQLKNQIFVGVNTVNLNVLGPFGVNHPLCLLIIMHLFSKLPDWRVCSTASLLISTSSTMSCKLVNKCANLL